MTMTYKEQNRIIELEERNMKMDVMGINCQIVEKERSKRN